MMGKKEMNDFGQLEKQTLIYLKVESYSLPMLGSQEAAFTSHPE